MMASAEHPVAGTILLPIDLHGVSRPTLDTLMHIAQHLESRVLGLLVDDPRLQRVAELPFTTEIVLSSGGERDLAPARVRAHFGRVSQHTQRVLNELARRHRVQLVFEAASGAPLNMILQRAAGANVFFPCRQRQPTPPRRRQSHPVIPRLGLVLGDTASDSRILTIARALVGASMVGRLDVLSPSPQATAALESLAHHGCRPHLLRLDDCSGAGLADLIRHSRYDLLILPFSTVQTVPVARLESVLAASCSQLLIVQ